MEDALPTQESPPGSEPDAEAPLVAAGSSCTTAASASEACGQDTLLALLAEVGASEAAASEARASEAREPDEDRCFNIGP